VTQQTKVTMIDDLDGESEAVETVRFGLEDTSYEIDLSDEHADELRAVLRAALRQRGTPDERWPVPGQRAAQAAAKAKASDPTPDDIRAWVREQGLEVSTLGRISTKVRQAYDAAQ